MKTVLLVLFSTILVNNVVLSRFLGLCPFLGVSKQIKTAGGMGLAVIFVITISSALSSVIYKTVLERFDITYLSTLVFILIIAALVQFIEMFLKRFSRPCTSLSAFFSRLSPPTAQCSAWRSQTSRTAFPSV